jgi:hypothetical protein
MSIEMKVKGLMIDPVSNMPIIILKNSQGEAVLPIWVGVFEANAIAMQLENVIEELRARIQRVVITDLRDNTFFAMIDLENEGGSVRVDARPSDAMALALRAGAPIFVDDEVITKSTSTDDIDGGEADRLRRWLETVDPEELGKYEM